MCQRFPCIQKKKEIEGQQEDLEAQLKFAESIRDAKSNADNLQGQLEWADVINLEKVTLRLSSRSIRTCSRVVSSRRGQETGRESICRSRVHEKT